MTARLPLPALDGRQPLGFLAGVGVLALLDRTAVSARLAWDDVAGVAVLHMDGTVEELVDILTASVVDTELAAGLPQDWLPAMGPSGSDPARLTRDAFAARLQNDTTGWASALWTDLALDRRGRCACTPFYAPMGKQSMRTMFEKPAQLVRADRQRLLREALIGWRRHDGFTGENLDVRALEEAAESQSGESVPSGVPGATWLAWAGLPLFRSSAAGSKVTAVGWHIPEKGLRGFGWPLWSEPLDRAAIEVLVDHPAVATALWAPGGADGVTTARVRSRRARDLNALGVFAVVASVRRRTFAGKSDGILVTERVS